MPPSVDQAWQTVLGQLQIEMPKASFDTWVRDTRVVTLDRDILRISVHNSYARDWLENRLTSTVNRLLIGILNREVNVEFVLDDHGESQDKPLKRRGDGWHRE